MPAPTAKSFTWSESIKILRPYCTKIMTPNGQGSGFLIAHLMLADTPHVAIGTAAHVVAHADYWNEPIRIQHAASGKVVFLERSSRIIVVDHERDTAAIIFQPSELPFPTGDLRIIPEDKIVAVGVEIGWLGFPAVASNHLCFFSGRTSCWIADEGSYLVDGVAINGVSGGPAFQHFTTDNPVLMGVVSAYLPNLATGNPLPGLCVMRDIAPLQASVKTLKSLDEARKAKLVADTQKSTPPPANPETEPNSRK